MSSCELDTTALTAEQNNYERGLLPAMPTRGGSRFVSEFEKYAHEGEFLIYPDGRFESNITLIDSNRQHLLKRWLRKVLPPASN